MPPLAPQESVADAEADACSDVQAGAPAGDEADAGRHRAGQLDRGYEMTWQKRTLLQMLAMIPFGFSLGIAGVEGWRLWLLLTSSYISARLFFELELERE